MYPRSVFALLLTIALLTIPAVSQTETPEKRGPRHQRAGLLKRADVNGDGQISRDEWKRNPRAFDRLDSNRDGFISRDEAQQAVLDRAERRHKALERIDKNNDGQISRDEWPRRSETFERLDQNHDGVLSREELAAGRRHRRPQ